MKYLFRSAQCLAILVGVIAASGGRAIADTNSEDPVAIQFPVEKFELDNGLTVLLQPDRRIPAVSVQTWYRVGSKDEVPGRTGLAHFFEHMMFKGTAKYPSSTWGEFLNSKGADTNAFTSYDYTGYYINAPSENLELIMDIESDRMRHLTLDPKEVNSEREVVKEERRMRYDDNIDGGMREKMAEVMFKKLPYRWLPIGFMVDLNAASIDDMHKFYKSFYSPNNAVLVIAGDMDVSRAKSLVKKYFSNLPREKVDRPQVTGEAKQTKMRSATISRVAQAPTLSVGYVLPDVTSKDHYALDLLGIVLGQGQSSRLYKRLVYSTEVATSTDSWSWGQTLAGQFAIGASLKPGVKADRVLSLIEGEVAKVRKKAVSQAELDKARNLFLKDYVDGLKRVSGKARLLAQYEVVFGDYKRIFSDLEEYMKVKPEDLLRVAKNYLAPERRNIVIVEPKKVAGGR